MSKNTLIAAQVVLFPFVLFGWCICLPVVLIKSIITRDLENWYGFLRAFWTDVLPVIWYRP